MANGKGIDYKAKYMDLRARYIQSLDMAFRTGYEQGMNIAQMQQMQQAQAQMEARQAQMQQMQGGDPNQGGDITSQDELQQAAANASPQPNQLPADQAQQDAMQSQLDAHIAELEGLVNKSEPSIDDLKKSINKFRDTMMHKRMLEVTKSLKPLIKKAKSPFKPSASYTHNLPEDSKKSLSMQEQIVTDIMKKWESEESKASEDMMRLIGTEALTKKE